MESNEIQVLNHPFEMGNSYWVFLPNRQAEGGIQKHVSQNLYKDKKATTLLHISKRFIRKYRRFTIKRIEEEYGIKRLSELLRQNPSCKVYRLGATELRCLSLIYILKTINIVFTSSAGLDFIGMNKFIRFVKHLSRNYCPDKMIIVHDQAPIGYSINRIGIYNLSQIRTDKLDVLYDRNVRRKEGIDFRL